MGSIHTPATSWTAYVNHSIRPAEPSRLVDHFLGEQEDFPGDGVLYLGGLFVPSVEYLLWLHQFRYLHLFQNVAFLVCDLYELDLAQARVELAVWSLLRFCIPHRISYNPI